MPESTTSDQRRFRGGGFNLQLRDNLFQLFVVALCAFMAAGTFYLTGLLEADLGSSAVALGGVIGAAVGLLLSGAALALGLRKP